MFNLFRRISYGAIPRTDRPWEDDPTSNAPNTRRKRRLSSRERDMASDEEPANKKKARGESASPSVANAEGTSVELKRQDDTEEVKEVTEGVKEVTLDVKASEDTSASAVAPEAVPLPEEKTGELDESPSEALPSLAAVEPLSEDAPAEESADDASDVASSSGDATSPAELEESSETFKLSSSVKSMPILSSSADANEE